MHPGNIGTAIVWAVVPAVVLGVVLYAIDRYEKEPVRLLLIAAVFGAIVAPAVTVAIQNALDVPTSMVLPGAVPFSRLNATTPIVQGLVLGATISLVCWLVRSEIDGLFDGVIYGAVVAVGFGMTASFVAILQTQSLGQDVSGSLFSATVAGLNFVLYGGVVGLVIAAARFRSTATFLLAAAAGTIVSTGLLLLHEYLPSWVATSSGSASSSWFASFIAGLPNVLGLVALGAIAVWSASRDAAIVAGELRDEVDSGVVTAQDYSVVTHPFVRAGSLLRTLVAGGGHRWRAQRRLYAAEVELAYAKHRRAGTEAPGASPPATRDASRQAALRRSIASSREELSGSGGREARS
jgi:protease PrsW